MKSDKKMEFRELQRKEIGGRKGENKRNEERNYKRI